MCVRPLRELSLDDLALLSSHPRATAAVQAAFHRALAEWTRVRVGRLRHRWPAGVEVDDVIQSFLLRCVSRHLPAWRAHRVALSPYLYRRLVGDACDVVRRHRRHERYEAPLESAASDDVVDDERDTETCLARKDTERRLRLVQYAVAALPARQRTAVETTLGGASLGEVARALQVHPSTMSRERTAAIATLRAALVAA
jgi:RNA polymerase sigma factor (sigma-70 family)